MARLLSVNVGLPRDVAWQGRTVHTGIWKAPVEGPRKVRRLNIDGDGQGDTGGHGGENRAVFVYQDESYRYWQKHLGRSSLVPGQFGENFTVEGLADTEVCIGDRYRIGTALFEVTQPRVTCYRLGIRMEEPDMAALLVKHGRPGFYFRVIEEGNVASFREHFVGENARQLMLADHHFHVDAKVVRIAEHFDDVADGRTRRRGPACDFDIDHEAFEIIMMRSSGGLAAENAMPRGRFIGLG